jgi:Zn-dependent peptidase ImmA (M78 family)
MASDKAVKHPKLPTKIKIGSQAWTVEERTKNTDGVLNEGNYGYTIQEGNVIVIDKAAIPSRKRQVLFHELFHAVRFSSGSSGIKPNLEDAQPNEIIDVWEHYFIAMYEDAFLTIIRDNPEVTSYLLSKE